MSALKSWIWKAISLIIPPVQLWKVYRAINQEKIVSEYGQGVERNLEEYSGDLQDIVGTVEEAHRSELDRNTHLDSKAGNYLGNLGVVLSILSLGPILSVVLGFDQNNVGIGVWPEGVVLLLFGFAVVSLLSSAYYSSKALKMRGYSVYFTADGISNRIGNSDPPEKEQIRELLICKKSNELHNQEKNNLISVAEEFSRNGLISLGLGIGIIVMMLLSLNPVQAISKFICSIL